MESQKNLSKKHSRTPPKGGRRLSNKARCEDGVPYKPDLRIGKVKFKQSMKQLIDYGKYEEIEDLF